MRPFTRLRLNGVTHLNLMERHRKVDGRFEAPGLTCADGM